MTKQNTILEAILKSTSHSTRANLLIDLAGLEVVLTKIDSAINDLGQSASMTEYLSHFLASANTELGIN